jgi:hypothetical protein
MKKYEEFWSLPIHPEMGGNTVFNARTAAVNMILVFRAEGLSMPEDKKVNEAICKASDKFTMELTKAIGTRYRARGVGKLELVNVGKFKKEEKTKFESAVELAKLQCDDWERKRQGLMGLTTGLGNGENQCAVANRKPKERIEERRQPVEKAEIPTKRKKHSGAYYRRMRQLKAALGGDKILKHTK